MLKLNIMNKMNCE